ncbi:MAG: tetratricopeptide repeat protein [Elusimicrobia bacterium]|nr:tetratricopeptide repeat protein [Elusimicrobiota bacterium]
MEEATGTAAGVQPTIPAGEHPRLWAPLLAAAATAAVFWPAVRNGFVNLDDTALGLRGLPRYHAGPASIHLASVLLHSLNAALFAVIAARLLRAAWCADEKDPQPWWWAGLAALLFSLHPLRVESVAWASAQRDLLCGTFCLISLVGYLKAAAAPGRWTWRGASWLAAGAAAVLAPSLAAPLALFLLMLDIYPLRRLPLEPRHWTAASPRCVLIEKLLFAAPALLAVWAATHAQKHAPAAAGLLRMTAWGTCRFLLHFGKTLWPAHLAPSPAAAYAAADRSSYLSCLPWALLAAAGLAAWARGSRARLASALAAATLLVGLLFGLTRLQLAYWRDSEALWSRVVAMRPDDAEARLRLGDVYYERRAVEEAFAQYKAALKLDPGLVAAHYALGRLYAAAGDHALAARCYGQALRLDPKELRAYNDLGVALHMHGEPVEAIALFQRGLAQGLDESLPAVRTGRLNLLNNLGNAWLESGSPREALAAYTRALRLYPADARGHYGCGLAWLRLGRPDKAVFCFREALRLNPGSRAVQVDLAAARARLARPSRSPSSRPRARR